MHRATPAQRRQMDEEGCIALPGALAPDLLEAVRAAFDRAAAQSRPQWVEGVAAGTSPGAFFDIPNAFALDPVFAELADHPAYYGLLKDFTGGVPQLIFGQFRTVPPHPFSYVGWHFDLPRDHPMHLKVQLYLDDVEPDGGPFAYVPGSHRPEAGPHPTVRRLEAMPGHRVCPGKAGSALLFNSFLVHTALPNRSATPRRSIIMAYEAAAAAGQTPDSFKALDDQIRGTERRRLFGLATAEEA